MYIQVEGNNHHIVRYYLNAQTQQVQGCPGWRPERRENINYLPLHPRFLLVHRKCTLRLIQPTVGIDFVTKTMQVEGETLRLQLWDTAGQERFRALIPSYVKDADTCLIVLDLGLRASFDNLNRWLDFVR